MPTVLTPLFGSDKSLSYEPHAYLLEIEEARILLDCGCFEAGSKDAQISINIAQLQAAYLDRLKELAPSLTLILLSAPTPAYLGLLPFLVNHCKLAQTCAIYASPPTLSLGTLALKEWAAALCSENDPGFSNAVLRDAEQAEKIAQDKNTVPWKFSPAQLQKALSRVTTLRYSSPVLLSGRNAPLTLIGNRAGFALGATVWSIRTPTNEEIMYAPAWHHVRERTLDGATISTSTSSSKLKQKGMIITNAANADYLAPKLAARKQAFLESISGTLESNHSVLLPSDASARIIELLVLLDQHWSFSHLQRYPLCFVARTAEELLLSLKNVFEFLGTNMTTSSRIKPGIEPSFILDNFRFFVSLEAYRAAFTVDQPRCVVSVPATLSYGYSRSLFPDFAAKSGNLILLTQPVEPGSLAQVIYQNWQNGQEDPEEGKEATHTGELVDLAGLSINLDMNERVNLEGQELATFQAKQKQEADAKAKERALQDRNRQLADAAGEDDDASSSEDEDPDSADEEMLPKAKRIALEDAETGAGMPIGGNLGFTSSFGGYSDEFIDESMNATQAGSFDIYVKGQMSKRTEFTLAIRQEDGTVYIPNLREQTRMRLFPFVEKKRKVDAYGEIIDVAGWLTRGKAEEASRAAAVEMTLGKRKRGDEHASKVDRAEPPHKYVTRKESVTMNCSVFWIDLGGKADGKAVKQLLPHLNPKKLILIGGNERTRKDLKDACLSAEGMTRDIFTPVNDEEVAVADDVDSFSLRLDDELVAALKMRRVEEFEITKLNGSIQIPDISSIPVIAKTGGSAGDRAFDRKVLLQSFYGTNSSNQDLKSDKKKLSPLAPSLFIGDVRLAVLKARLIALKVPSSYAGEGILVCGPAPSAKAVAKTKDPKARLTSKSRSSATPDVTDNDHSGGKVAVRKDADGTLRLEGQPGETFEIVRQTIYSALLSC